MTLSVAASTKKEFYVALNELHEVTEADVLKETPSRLYVGSTYYPCWIVGAKKLNGNIYGYCAIKYSNTATL